MKKRNMKGKHNPMFGKRHTLAARASMRQSKIGTQLSKEHKRRISEACKGVAHPKMRGRAPWNKGRKAA